MLRNLTAVEFEIARNSAAAYYPEANPLVALQNYDARSGTPAYKSIPVRVRAAVTPSKRKNGGASWRTPCSPRSRSSTVRTNEKPRLDRGGVLIVLR